MNVFLDYHHGDLYYSLFLLLEKRLGFKLYRPIGMEWFHQGFWKIADPYPTRLDTAKQYLALTNKTISDPIKKEWFANFENGKNEEQESGIHYLWQRFHGFYHRGVTLQKFKEMKFDIILPTFPGHDFPYEKLRNLYQPKAKLIMQMGNINQKTHIKNVLSSVPYQPLHGQNVCFYHQELNPDIYSYVIPPAGEKSIFSFVNLLPYPELYKSYKNEMEDINFKAYGANAPDGLLSGSKAVAAKMREANLGWHVRWNEAFGHTAMGWGASGRFVLLKGSTLRDFGKHFPPLFVPGVNCIDLDAYTVKEGCSIIRRLLQPQVNAAVSEKALEHFHKVINYERDQRKVKNFLERIL